jgi:hypothetical protein
MYCHSWSDQPEIDARSRTRSLREARRALQLAMMIPQGLASPVLLSGSIPTRPTPSMCSPERDLGQLELPSIPLSKDPNDRRRFSTTFITRVTGSHPFEGRRDSDFHNFHLFWGLLCFAWAKVTLLPGFWDTGGQFHALRSM